MPFQRQTSTEDWGIHRRALESWRGSYIEYLAAGPNYSRQLRTDLDSLTGAADQALKAAEHEVAAPSVRDGGFDRSLAGAVVWIHDRGHKLSSLHSEILLDTVNRAIGVLATNEREAGEHS